MRILFLGNSNERLGLGPGIPLRHELVQRQLEPDYGEVEFILKSAWPDERFPGAVGRWLEQLEPDVLYVNVAEFWCLTESIPLRIQRNVPILGRPLARLAVRSAETPAVSDNRVFRGLHRLAQRFIGGDPQFDPSVVVERVMECVRVALRREGLVVVVDGQRGRRPWASTEKGRKRVEARRQATHVGLREACARLHVVYESDDVPQWKTHPSGMDGYRDGLHQDAEGQVWMATETTALIRHGLAVAGR